MSNDIVQSNSTQILIDAIEKRAAVRDILQEAKEKIDAADVRFRLRSWNDKSVVHVANWIIEEPKVTGLASFEPELAERFYYDPERPSRKDCRVGLEGRIGRIKEEQGKIIRDEELLRVLNENIEGEIKNRTTCFPEKEGEKLFDDFLQELNRKREDLRQKREWWEKYLKELNNIKNQDKESFFNGAINENSPWMAGTDRNEITIQWNDLQKYLESEKPGSEVKEFVIAVEKTVKHYDKLCKQYEKYISSAKSPKYEIAVPVMAFDKFIGVLNFHRKDIFTNDALHLAEIYAARLAVTYLQWQDILFDKFQKVAQPMTAENNFELIASKITEGVRIGLRHGLQEKQVFPLLYIPKQPVHISKNLNNDEYLDENVFKKMWEASYQPRQEPNIEYLLSWDEISGNDSAKFIEFLRQNYGVNWVRTKDIKKTNSGSLIKISFGDKSLSFRLTNKKSKAILEIDGKKIDEFMVKRENELKIYDNRDHKLWKEENKLGNISIRYKGFGWKVIQKWGEKMRSKQTFEAKDFFKVCPYVDNPNSDCGSRSAFYHHIKTTGCIPLTFEKRIYGLLYLHCKVRHFFTYVELNALNTFCIQAAIAIHNAKLTGDSYEKLYGKKLLEFLLGEKE